MKKPAVGVLALITCVFVFFAAGVFMGRNLNRAPVRICPLTEPAAETLPGAGIIDLNTADAAQLETLPGIGPVLARRILEYREASGGFRTVEELTMVNGIGTQILTQIWDLITVGG